MLTYPNIDPVALHIYGPLSIHWYGLMYLCAFLAAWGLASYRAKNRPDWNSLMISDLVFYGALGVILGGRIGSMLFYNFSALIKDPLMLFRVWEGGMSFHGGLIGVIIAMLLFCRKYNKSAFETLDFVTPCGPLGLMFGRIGNFINGELYGRPVDPNFPLSMVFPTDPMAVARHPSQLYQAFAEGLLVFIIVWWFSAKPRPRMAVSALFLIGYGIARFSIEFFREPDDGKFLEIISWMTRGQLLTIPMIIIGMILFYVAYQKKVYDWGPNKTNTQVK